MDFSKPIYGEVAGFIKASIAKAYFKNHGIEYTEQLEDDYYIGNFYVFKFPELTKEQLEMATKYTEVKFYQ